MADEDLEAVAHQEPDTEDLDELIDQAQAEEQAEQDAAEALSEAEKERARELARKINDGFLWVVDRTQCPSASIDELTDREQGVEALTPLAEEWGGEIPDWLRALLDKYDPYIKAGWYMGMTIYTARAVERQIQEQAEKQRQQEGAPNGGQPEHEMG